MAYKEHRRKGDKNTGQKFDGGKLMYELMPQDSLEGVVRVLTYGANKYAAFNWKKVRPIFRYYGALIRHLEDVRAGQWVDKESGLPHLDHAMCNLVFMRHLLNGHDEDMLKNEFIGEGVK